MSLRYRVFGAMRRYLALQYPQHASRMLSELSGVFDLPHHLADGSLNPCIQCDEDESGPIFKLVSGRTRRNSGLASGLCRPCETVFPLTHSYGFDSSSSGSGR